MTEQAQVTESVNHGELVSADKVPLKVRLVFAQMTNHFTVPVERDGKSVNLVFSCRGIMDMIPTVEEAAKGHEIYAEFFKQKTLLEDMWYLKCQKNNGDEYHNSRMTQIGMRSSVSKFTKSDLRGTIYNIQIGLDDLKEEFKQGKEVELIGTLQQFVESSKENLASKK